MRQGLWAARASAARPCCPSQGRELGLVRSRPASAGAWLASTRWCCACCGVSRSRPSPGSSACRSGNWSVGRRGPSPKRPTASLPPRLSISPSTPPAGRCGPTPPVAFCSATTTAAPLWAAPLCPTPSRNQIAFLGLTPSFAFVRQPETNGVAERFIRTLKEQVVWGRIFRNAEEVRAAVRAFVARYNEHWLLEKNAYRSPAQTRREWFAALAPIKAVA